ncbi:hypothetical protein BJ986_003189 [Phycicoccus badiiscoriae]|uniref:Uncharacterized protein n=1 Tax=Pedococcus badiiscoriae TaxID=642776 RepID=A0A852WU40_9MICO|nr:hypothetical protein [Pedococcus badiiscoriae]
MLRIALCAGFLCAAWILLGAGQAKADESPRPAHPGVTVRLGEAAPLVRAAERRPAAAVSAGVRHIVRPVRPAKAAVREASEGALPTVRTVFRSAAVARPVRLVSRAVGEVARVPAAIAPTLPTVPRLGPLPSVRALDLAPRLQPSAGPGPSSASQPQADATLTSATSRPVAPRSNAGDLAGFTRAPRVRPLAVASPRSTVPGLPTALLLLGSSTDQAASGIASGTTDFAALGGSGPVPQQTSVSCVLSATTAESAPTERPNHRPG